MLKNEKSAMKETNSGSAANQQVEKKKRVRRKRDVDDIQPDSNAEDDTEEDKADLLLSQAFLQKEKTCTLQLDSTIIELKEAIQRHQLYMKHFKGVSPHCLPYKKKKRAPTKPKRIPCATCGKEVNFHFLKFHMETVHNNGERSYLCEQCGASFTVNKALRSHVRNMHGTNSRTHICTVCNKGFKFKTHLKEHVTIHTGEKPFQCTYCDKKFRTRIVLVKHERTHTGERPYGPCEFCGLWFPYRFTYVSHLRTHNGKSIVRNNAVDPETGSLKCSTCGLTFKREYAFLIHEAAHKKEDPKLLCLYCTKTYPSMKLLKKHSHTEHPEKYYRCDQCPSFFLKKQTFDDHMLSHLNQAEKFPCSVCGKEYPTKLRLKIHVKGHLIKNSSVFQCQFCSKMLRTKNSLVEHERIHTRERPFGCPHCPKFFRMKPHLENHIRIHTGEKPFVCIHCGKAFSAKRNMDTHLNLHTGKKNQCSKCGETFRSLVKLKQHQQTHDDEEDERDSNSVSEDEEDQ